jgi:hypothetical protein
MSLSATPAEAKNRDALIIGGAILGGALLGGIIGANTRPRAEEVDYAPHECWRERQLVGYTHSGRRIYRRVTVCD